MRLFRLGALVGSVVVLVATLVSMVNQRAEQRAEQQARVTSTVLLADQSVQNTVLRALAVVDVVTAETDPATIIRTFAAGASACVQSDAGGRCTAGDLSATSAFGDAVSDAVERGEPAIVVDDATDTLLAVARAGDVTTALQLPVAGLVGPIASAAIEGNGAVVAIELTTNRGGAGAPDRSGPTTVDGRVVVVDTISLPGDGGAVRVSAAVDDGASLLGEGGTLYVLLLALGSVLAALAGWTFLLDRRSLERQATTDDLTGLPNRREFERITEEELLAAGRFNTGVCVMLIDLNGFKQINDTLGHQFGDLVLRAAAKRLRNAVRDTDVVARWGGDEFVILLPGVEDASGVRASAERIGGLLGDTPIADDVVVTAAIGAALFPRHGSTLDELVRAADEAMYGAKSTGVVHRLADGHSIDTESSIGRGYAGPDRRRSREHDRV
jgi:diguanylate cyclase (GGDEF)-like protein